MHDIEKQFYTDRNKREYSSFFDDLQFVSASKAAEATQERAKLLDTLSNRIKWGYSHTKTDISRLSPGCRICAEGKWSCLFINGICNCKCFYCPSRQDEEGLPMTSSLEFESATDYADYVEKFGFTGVSISGGEPFLTFERTIEYLTVLKNRFNDLLHLWLYTNGKLVTTEKLLNLKMAGLKEIRFDLSARDYQTDKIKLAVGIIPVVTVEIPAIPEDFERVKTLVQELADMGVNHLNLHHIRITEFNYKMLIERGYTFLHGEKITVLESELTALKILAFVDQNGTNLPVNYCSFVYKNQYQAMAARKRHAAMIRNQWEDLTGVGKIRALWITGKREDLKMLVSVLQEKQIEDQLYFYQPGNDRISFSFSLLKYIDTTIFRLGVSYYATSLRPRPSFYFPGKEVLLNDHRKVVIERKPVMLEVSFSEKEAGIYKKYFLENSEETNLDVLFDQHPYFKNCGIERLKSWTEIMSHERIRSGLAEYF